MKTLLSLLILFSLMACSSSEQMVVKDEPKKANPYDESFDPNSLNDDDIVVGKYATSQAVTNTPAGNLNSPLEETLYSEVKGFRVQIIATKSIETATLAEQEAKELFEGMNQKTYLIFDAPLYKLRVGDATTRDAAEEIRDVAKDYGYREAFIVPTKVNVTTNSSTPQ
jgi:uncharacterized protein YcfL